MSISDIPPPKALKRSGLRTVTTNREADQVVQLPPGVWALWFGQQLLDELERRRHDGQTSR